MVMISPNSLLALAAAITSTRAAPTPFWGQDDVFNFNWPGAQAFQKNLASRMPTVTGLPSNTNVTLQHVALGVGVQNYTCDSTTAAPKAAGALATLFDTTALFLWDNIAINDLSTQYLHSYESESCTKFNQTDVTKDCCEEKANRANRRLRKLGHHYFANRNGKAEPFFDLNRAGETLSAGAIASVKPTGDLSVAGSDGVGSVNWLMLVDDQSGYSHGLTEVYRVKTAGGNPTADACKAGEKVIGVKYTAEYWFFK